MKAKFVRDFLFEKFTDDSDPIRDIGIGVYASLIPKLHQKYRWEETEPKDHDRIESLINKSKGSLEKEMQHARNMAKAIDTPSKAYRRYKAAKAARGEGWPVTDIFLIRAIELNKADLER